MCIRNNYYACSHVHNIKTRWSGNQVILIDLPRWRELSADSYWMDNFTEFVLRRHGSAQFDWLRDTPNGSMSEDLKLMVRWSPLRIKNGLKKLNCNQKCSASVYLECGCVACDIGGALLCLNVHLKCVKKVRKEDTKPSVGNS